MSLDHRLEVGDVIHVFVHVGRQYLPTTSHTTRHNRRQRSKRDYLRQEGYVLIGVRAFVC